MADTRLECAHQLSLAISTFGMISWSFVATASLGFVLWAAGQRRAAHFGDGSAAVLNAKRIACHGRVLRERKIECIASFPGKYGRAWNEVVKGSRHMMSVACVFLMDKEHGYGRVDWDNLRHVDLWDGIGLGGSQKCEVAFLDKHYGRRRGPDGKFYTRREWQRAWFTAYTNVAWDAAECCPKGGGGCVYKAVDVADFIGESVRDSSASARGSVPPWLGFVSRALRSVAEWFRGAEQQDDHTLHVDRAGLHTALAVGAWRSVYMAYHKQSWFWECCVLGKARRFPKAIHFE
eukprot:gene57490-biopygen62339